MSTLSRMMDPAAFEPPHVYDFLAQQLLRHRLCLVLGSGVSVGFGLPNWSTLTKRTADMCGCSVPAGLSEETAAEFILKHCGNDDIKFAECVRRALYEGFDTSLRSLIHNPLMAALGALTMASARGAVSTLVSFNFDDLLETYLRYYGFSVEPVVAMPAWSSSADVRIYHQHGFLPHELSGAIPGPIVFAQVHFDRIVGNATDAWHRTVTALLASHTCIFVGLSGNDKNLTSMLHAVRPQHAAIQQQHAFWGVRFSDDAADPLRHVWDTRGVCQITTTAKYADLPVHLLEICQRAAAIEKDFAGF